VLLAVGCSPSPERISPTPVSTADRAGSTSPGSPAPTRSSGASTAQSSTAPRASLRPGEKLLNLSLPRAYTPAAPRGGTDDYRCFLLDPKLRANAFVTGYDVLPGQEDVVHHVILYRVPPASVAKARARDAATQGDGWTCFGGTGLDSQGATLNDAPWVGAWAPGGQERVLAPDIGIPLAKGSLLVLQVHYNLLRGAKSDRTSVNLRLSTSATLAPLETMLLPAPVELPCRPGRPGKLCDRDRAVLDVGARFGERASATVAGLLVLCQGDFVPRPGATQSCTRRVEQPATVRAAAGHMHLLGTAIRIELNPGTPADRTLLDVKRWDFDNQGSIPVAATRLRVGDQIRVTCTHDQSWRDKLAELRSIPERYVVWGEGTTDEMCLGILSVTRP
jgi:hypothetical protein